MASSTLSGSVVGASTPERLALAVHNPLVILDRRERIVEATSWVRERPEGQAQAYASLVDNRVSS
jgi:hypothetical protein